MKHAIGLIFAALLGAAAASAASITVTSVADAGSGTYNLTNLGTTDWVHFSRIGDGLDSLRDDRAGSTAIGDLTSNQAIGGYGVGNSNPVLTSPSNTYSWTNGTPTAAASLPFGAIINGSGIQGVVSYFLPVAASTSSQRLVLFLGGFYLIPGQLPDPTGTLTASLNDGSGQTQSISFSGRRIATIDFTADSASILSVSFGADLGILPGTSANFLTFDGAYLTNGPTGEGGGEVPEPSTLGLAGVGAVLLW